MRRLKTLVVLGVLVVLACVGGSSSVAAGTGIDLRIDFETGTGSQFSGLECPHPSTQFQVYSAGASGLPAPRQGTYAGRFSESPADVWPGNNMVRCLGARYDSGETAGRDYYYGFSLWIPPAGLGDNLIWELHQPSSLYSLAGCGVAPFALVSSGGGLQFRISTGNCTLGAGFAYWSPHTVLPELQAVPRATWIDFLVHIVFSETNGTLEVSYRTGDVWPSAPQLARYGIPTLPYASSAGVHNVVLYTEMGLYSGYAGYDDHDSVVIDGYRRGASKDSVMAEFPAGSAPVSPVQPPAVVQSIRPGDVLSGVVDWTATPTVPVKQIVFALDGNKITSTDSVAPYDFRLDTTKLSNGAHALGLTVTLLDGTVVWEPYQLGNVTVDNGAPVVPPTATAAPLLSGSAVDGASLSANTGSWTNSPTGYAYGWQSSKDGGATWQPIAGATSPAFTLTDAQIGVEVRVVVGASNSAGSGSSASAATAAVAPPAIVQSVAAGDTLSGLVTWTATPSAAVRQVVFALDSNRITHTETSAPFVLSLDTTKLSNGTHTLGLTVTLQNGSVVWQPYQIGTVSVSNPAH